MKKIAFITGTRADYGKIKPLIKKMEEDERFEVFIFVCGMHLLETFGNTYREVLKDGYKNVYVDFGLIQSTDASVNLGNTISSFTGFVQKITPDIIIVHGDRIDALAGAAVGALHNILVGHVEGGELSGTIDDSIRHAVSKFAHIHFVCTEEAKHRLIQLGEEESRIYTIGSPDIDVMLSDNLPSIEEAKERYEIDFDRYGILMYHPVTTERDTVGEKIEQVVTAVMESGRNYIVVYPNNDLGSEVVINEYNRFKENPRFRMFPSIRFEYFLTFLKNADVMIGNSSAGIRETGVFGVPAIDIGTRQNSRYSLSVMKNIQHVDENAARIGDALSHIEEHRIKTLAFGKGNSKELFYQALSDDRFWNVKIQKVFVDYN